MVEVLQVVGAVCGFLALVGFAYLGVRTFRPAPAAVEPAPSPDPWAVVVARRVIVNLKSGRAIDGVLVRRDGPLLFLRNAVLLEEGSEPAAIDGEAVVEAVDIDFIQAL
ncbi:RNA binding protein [Arthrobacter phage Galaxy]|uniref:RNA binding protein n=1 Tax=Arthrobacter phage Galaxy TaxID=1772326 RepID=A0A0U4JXJ2_9CAUD|nr:RNA binding domain protein [Arthrobacter phage Galaxy]ALY08850.1 RNA binding protein [Arthrobacter phage Galaxy]